MIRPNITVNRFIETYADAMNIALLPTCSSV